MSNARLIEAIRPPVARKSITKSDDTEVVADNPEADGVDLQLKYPRAVWVGVAGNLALKGLDGVVAVYTNVPVGRFEGYFTHLMATDTTADEFVAEW